MQSEGFFFGNTMSRTEYMRIHYKYFPPDIRALYHIDVIFADNGYSYIKIIKGMYSLKRVAIIEYNQLIYHMDTHSYYPVPFKTELWAHKTGKQFFASMWMILE